MCIADTENISNRIERIYLPRAIRDAYVGIRSRDSER